jgi:hypothetical protein
MMSAPLHLVLFLIGTLPIPLLTLFLLHADDRSAFAEFPRRAVSFVGSLILLGVGMLLAARLFT